MVGHMTTQLGSATTALRDDPARLDSIYAGLREHVARGTVPAAALAIGDSNGEIRSESFGGRRGPVSPDSYFFLASVTKPIFATAFMQLVEEGKVDLDEPISRWITEFAAGDKARVTARHLLTHTSGVPDFPVEQLARQRPSYEKMLRATAAAPLHHEPGTWYEYCTATFVLLAAIIERLSGIRYREYLHKRVLAPLDMHSTFDPRRAGRPIVPVEGIGVDNRIIRFLMLRYMAGAALPGGGLFGTVGDLTRFGAALLRPRQVNGHAIPIARATFDQMGEDQLRGITGIYDQTERPVHQGLGWGKPNLMHELPGSPRVVSHGGASGTRLWIDPDIDLVFVYFTNRWGADRSAESDVLRGVYRAIETA